MTEDNKTYVYGGVKARNRCMRNRLFGGVGGRMWTNLHAPTQFSSLIV